MAYTHEGYLRGKEAIVRGNMKWYKKNRAKRLKQMKEYKKKWAKENEEKIRLDAERYHTENRDRILRQSSERKIQVRRIVLKHYSIGDVPKCECCGEEEIGFLTINHINNDGYKHKREVGRGGYHIYLWIVNHNFPKGFNVLCFNCNCGSYRNGGVCPHVGKGVVTMGKSKGYDKVKQKNAEMKRLVFNHYSGGIPQCACCGERNEAFLTLNHMNGDGAEHRRKVGNGYAIYKWVIQNNYPEDFNILCCNCNCGSGRRSNKTCSPDRVCPHKLKKGEVG